MLKFQVILLTLALFRPIAAKGIKCETIEIAYWYGVGEMKTCLMKESASITTTETKITEPKDEIVEAINYSSNNKIEFLPVEIYKIFPNLRGMIALSCSLKTISKKNFEKLSKLEGLDLRYNQIEKIPTNAFEDLKSLKKLWLTENKIKFLNGQAFNELPKLSYVDLERNVCINKWFNGAEAIATLKTEAHEKCGFHETEVSSSQMKEITQECNELSEKNTELQSENEALSKEIAELKSKIEAISRKNSD